MVIVVLAGTAFWTMVIPDNRSDLLHMIFIVNSPFKRNAQWSAVNKLIKIFSSSRSRGCEYVDNPSEAAKNKGFRKRISVLIIKGQAVKALWTKIKPKNTCGQKNSLYTEK